MKIYSTIVTIIAVIAIGGAGYLFWSQSVMRSEIVELKMMNEGLGKDKTLLEGKLSQTNEALNKIRQSNEVFKTVVNSFMYAGDIKASNIGSKEGKQVDTAIENIQDSMNRMSAEKDWGDFKQTLGFNPLFGLLRSLANSMNQEIINLNGPSENLQPQQLDTVK